MGLGTNARDDWLWLVEPVPLLIPTTWNLETAPQLSHVSLSHTPEAVPQHIRSHRNGLATKPPFATKLGILLQKEGSDIPEEGLVMRRRPRLSPLTVKAYLVFVGVMTAVVLYLVFTAGSPYGPLP